MSKLFIIPGHGAGDCGACGNGYQEAERVRALAQRIKDFGGDDVVLSDFGLNSYRSNIIGKGLVPKGYKILELHMDSSENSSAKGGHVIINGKFKADEYDNALAMMISGMFPGRSQTIVGRTDLANVNRSASMGYNYRLMECGFISNAEDVQKFNSRMDELAKGILGCFGIGEKAEIPTPNPTPTTAPSRKTVDELAREVMAGLHGNGHENRKASLAKQGYNNYEEVRARVNELSGIKPNSAPKVNYYDRYFGSTSSIVTALNSLGIASSFANRKNIAKVNGISNYTGTALQNIKLLNLLKQGKLIKP